jgi:hypothetical protein
MVFALVLVEPCARNNIELRKTAEQGKSQMARSTTEKERKEAAEKAVAREVKQPYSTEVEDREAETAQKQKPAPQLVPPAAKRDA